MALNISSRKQLFIDQRLVASSDGVALAANLPRFEGVVLEPGPDGDWDDRVVGPYGQVMEDGGIYRMWMGCFGQASPHYKLGYAESTDGVNWVKPELGLHEFGGSQSNNICCRDWGYVFKDPKAPEEEQYRLLVQARHYSDVDILDGAKGGFHILTSSNGLDWKWTGRRVFPFQADTLNQVDYDERVGRYVAYVRTWPQGFLRERELPYGRAVGRIEIDDPLDAWPYEELDEPFLTRTDSPGSIPTVSREVPTVLEYPGYADAGNWVDLYTPAIMQYPGAEDAYFAFPSLNCFNPDSEIRNHSTLNIGMAVSRDGDNWDWPSLDPNIPFGDQGSGRSKSLYMLYGGIRVGDEIYQYHAGSDGEHGSGIPTVKRIFRISQRVDGFVSADFDASGGRLNTPEMSAVGDALYLNVNAGRGIGHVAILDETDQAIDGFGLEDCDDIRVDSVSQMVTWCGRSPGKILNGRVSLQFEMRDTRMFAF